MKAKHLGSKCDRLYTEFKGPSTHKEPRPPNTFIERNKKSISEIKPRSGTASKATNQRLPARKDSIAAVKSKPLTADEKKMMTVQNKVIGKVVKSNDKPEETEKAEDIMLAFELLNKYKKDKDYI